MKKIIILIIMIFIVTGCNHKEDSMKVNININNKNYIINLEDNETAKEFANLLPKEFNMFELNDNEKYVYMDEVLSTKEEKVGYINVGDVYLYGNNCLVIFYKSFKTNYSYTKIGHIDNLPDLGSSNVNVNITK